MRADAERISEFLQTRLTDFGLDEVTAVEAARWLDEAGVLRDSPHRPGLPLRNLLRAGVIPGAEQRPPGKHGRWFIAQARDDRTSPAPALPRDEHSGPASPGHATQIDWMGSTTPTLADLLTSELRIVCVGINPSPRSVAVGHYYQGSLGQRFFDRLREAEVLPARRPGQWEDDFAFERGIGFTDIVKRPTARANELSPEELAYGRTRLTAKLATVTAELLIFSFKKAADKLIGRRTAVGFIEMQGVLRAPGFVMPGPYERRDSVDRVLGELRAWARRR